MPRLPSAGDVDRVSPARDPGLNVPPGAFQSTLGIAAEEFLPAADTFAQIAVEKEKRLAAANDRIQKRQEALDRIRAETEFNEGQSSLLEATRATGGFDAPGAMEAFGASGQDAIEDLVKAHPGSEESKLQLRASLEANFQEFSDKGATAKIEADDKRVQDTAGTILNSLAARALQGESPTALIEEGMRHIAPGENLADAMRVGDEVVFARNLNDGVISATIERSFIAGDIRTVEKMLEDPAVQRRLSTEKQIGFFKRIDTIRKDRDKPIILGPGDKAFTSSGEEIASGGPKPSKPFEIFDETSPTGTKFVTEEEALGEFGRQRGPVVSIINESESAMTEELGKQDAKRVVEIEDRAQVAFRTLAEVDRMKAAIDSGRFTTGVFSGARVFMSRFANFVGASEETLQLLGDAATSDTLDAAANRLGVDAAQKLGRVTNMSLQFIRDSMPSLLRTPEGNLILMDVMKRTSEREIEIASIANDFIQRHRAGEGNPLRPPQGRSFFQAVKDLEEEDPVITDDLRERIMQGSRAETSSFRELFKDKSNTVSTQEEFDALPSGTIFVWGPTGQKGQKK